MPPGSPLFTIVVPTYDRPRLLSEAIDSIWLQTVTDFECLIVDDASPEPVRLPPGSDSDDRFRVIRRETNGGQGASINTGIRNARGRYLVFLDDDDRMLPQRLEIALQGFRDAPVSICLSALFGDEPTPPPSRRPRTWNGDVARTIRESVTPNLGQTAVERERVVLFDESFKASADVEWWIRLVRENRVRTIERVGFLYRVHRRARHNNPGSARLDSLLRIFDLHVDYFDANPRSAAFHLRRAGLCALRAGQPGRGARLFLRSFARFPHPKTLWHMARACFRAGRT